MTRPLPEVLGSLGGPRLVVLGDLILDRYLTGVVDRISPEAPIQVLRVEKEEERLGGAGSVALNVRVLGASVTLVGVVGDDPAGSRLAARAREQGIELAAAVDRGRRTGVKTRHLARSHASAQQVLRVDEETVAPVGAGVEAELERHTTAALAGASALLVSDYGKGALTPSLLTWLVAEAHARGVPIVIDPKGDRYGRYRGATALTPNRAETRQATGIEIAPGDVDAAERAAERLIEEVDLAFVLLTLDREGMYLRERGRRGILIPTTPREVFDVTGAGDMVLSVLALALAAGAAPEEAARLANVAAGLEVERVGVVPIRRDEIAARLAQGPEAATVKLLDLEEARQAVRRHRALGRRVVFTNGCFDVLHAGHVRFLQAARAEGDVLIVGLNDDASVRRLKGAGRPVNPVSDRVDVLAALASVDHVVLFEADVPQELIEALAPDVLVKGEDWRDKGVVGREIVEARGGRVVLLPLLPGRSTTQLIARMRREG